MARAECGAAPRADRARRVLGGGSVRGKGVRVPWVIVLLALLLLPTPARAGSVFAREGLGEWCSGYDERGRALGATGIGVADPLNVMSPNPAAAAFSDNTLGHVGLDMSVRWTSSDERKARRAAAEFSSLGLYAPLMSGLGLRVMMRPATDGTYAYEEVVDTGSGSRDNIRREEGSRGLLRYDADLIWRHRRAFAIGAGVGLISGSLLDETSYAFADSGWSGTSDRRELRIEPAFIFTGSMLVVPWSHLSLGGFVTTGARSDATERYRTAGGTDWERDSEVEFPLAAGGGVGLLVSSRLRLSADVIWHGWEDVILGAGETAPPGVAAFRNTLGWGVGVERLPLYERQASAWQRLALRLGYAHSPWYVEDADGDPIDEWRVTGGIGIPIQITRGSIDLTLEWGQRGSAETNGITEDHFRIGLGFTFARVLREY